MRKDKGIKKGPRISKYTYPEIDYITLNPDKPFGPQLVHLRRNNKITGKELSLKIGRCFTNLSHWEHGHPKHIGNLDTAVNYAKAFNVKELRIVCCG